MLTREQVSKEFEYIMEKYRISCGPTGCQLCADNKYDLFIKLIEEYDHVYPDLKLKERLPKKCTWPHGIPE